MMKRFAVAALALTLCAALAPPADAVPVTSDDDVKFWTGWANAGGASGDDLKDSIGTPDIQDGVGFGADDAIEADVEIDITTNKAYMSQVKFNYELTGLFSRLQLGDLFIGDLKDGDADSWDWVVRASDVGKGTAAAGFAVDVYDFRTSPIALSSRANYGLTGTGGGGNGATKYNSGLDGSGNAWDYVLSGRDNKNRDKNAGNDNGSSGSTTSGNNTGVNWSGYLIRDDHPWALSYSALGGATPKADTDALGKDGTVSGWNSATGNNKTLTFDIDKVDAANLNPFAGVELTLDNLGGGIFETAFRIGFAFNCGNDVIFADLGTTKTQAGPEVPEPSTVVLLATGLVALVGYRRRRA